MDETKSLAERNIETLTRLRRADERDRGITEEEKAQAKNLLKIPSILRSADEPRRIYIDEMRADDGAPYYVEYCMLNTAEMKEVLSETNLKDRNLLELFMRVRKADPTVLEEDIRKLPDQYIQLILLKIRREEDYRFLLPTLNRNLSSLSLR